MTDKEILDLIAALLKNRNGVAAITTMEGPLQSLLDDVDWDFAGMGTIRQRQKARDFCNDQRVRSKTFAQLTDNQQGYYNMMRDKHKRFHTK
jgi:hypothetical protein